MLLPWVFIAALKLSLVEATKGYVLVVMHRLLTAVSALVAEHRLQDAWASVVSAPGLWSTELDSCVSQTQFL